MSDVEDLGKAMAQISHLEGVAGGRESAAEARIAQLREERERLKTALTEARHSLNWIEARATDLQFELKSAQARLAESQAMRKALEGELEHQRNEVRRLLAEVEGKAKSL